jgi:general secretion pathway protein D
VPAAPAAPAVESVLPAELFAQEPVVPAPTPVAAAAAPAPAAPEEPIDEDIMAALGEKAPVKAPQPVARPVAAAPADAVEKPGTSVVEDQEILRRRAYAAHARELLSQAEEDLRAGRYKMGIDKFRNALKGLTLPADAKERKRAERGLAECYFANSIYLEKQNDLNAALVAAKQAMDAGHPQGEQRLIELKEMIDKPRRLEVAKPAPVYKQQEYRDNQKKAAETMKRGRQYFMAGQYDKAAMDFKSVLALDPQNSEAMRLLYKAEQVLYDRSSMELEATRQNMMADVRATWNPRDYHLIQESTAKLKPGDITRISTVETTRAAIERKLKEIVIPEIDFRLANINDVVAFLQEQSREFDKTETDEGRKGVNIILNLRVGQAAAAAPAPALDVFAAAPPAGEAAAGAGQVPLITFSARYISLFEALKIVTQVATLKYRIEGRVVMIVPMNAPEGDIVIRMYDVLPSVEEKIPQLGAEVGGGGGGGGGFRALEPTAPGVEGADWKEFFRSMGVSWPDGSSIKYVRAIGKIVVANTEDNLTKFEQVLSVLNVVPNQIEIEARFVEVSRADISSLGFEWLINDDWEVAHNPADSGLPPASRRRVVVEGGATAGNFTKGNRFLSRESVATAVADDVLKVSSILTNPELSFVLHALEQRGFADLLSAPKVTTQAGQDATIKVVTEYIYPTDFTVSPITSTAVNGTTASNGGIVEPGGFETREVGVILNVLPDVSPEGRMINLTMTPEVVSEPEWKDYGSVFTDANGNETRLRMEQPFFHTRSVSTSISIYNGATVVMGGMITENRKNVDDKVPFLGDIPILGRLFRSKSERSEKRNLLIFVTAKLVTPDGRPVERQGDTLAGKFAEAGVIGGGGGGSEAAAVAPAAGLSFP